MARFDKISVKFRHGVRGFFRRSLIAFYINEETQFDYRLYDGQKTFDKARKGYIYSSQLTVDTMNLKVKVLKLNDYLRFLYNYFALNDVRKYWEYLLPNFRSICCL